MGAGRGEWDVGVTCYARKCSTVGLNSYTSHCISFGTSNCGSLKYNAV
jgi:hypothetical protein